MNLPNKLTMLRILLVPFFVVFVYFEKYPVCQVLALVLFISASITDLLDGRMTVYAAGRRVPQTGRARTQAAYGALVEAAQALLEFARGCRGRSNRDLTKFTGQIRALIEKWK